MNLPNLLTMIRIALIPVFLFFALVDGPFFGLIALLIFIIASITDHIDGHIARKYNLITNFGKIMDPLADKLLVTAAFLVFVAQGRMSCIPVMIILAREFAVTSLRVVAAGEGKVLAAGMSGKVKTVSQIFYIILMLLNIGSLGMIPVVNLLVPFAGIIEQIAMWLVTAITLYSGCEYFYQNRAIVLSSIK